MAERKLVELEKWDRDSADAVRWLRKNQDKFRMQVFEPPLLILNVPDWRFTDAVEGCFNSNQIRVSVYLNYGTFVGWLDVKLTPPVLDVRLSMRGRLQVNAPLILGYE